jgi:hypothetical protein
MRDDLLVGKGTPRPAFEPESDPARVLDYLGLSTDLAPRMSRLMVRGGSVVKLDPADTRPTESAEVVEGRPAWVGYEMAIWGLRAAWDLSEAVPPWPYFTGDPEGTELPVYQILVQTAYKVGSPLAIERRRMPAGRQHISIVGLENPHTEDDIREARAGLALVFFDDEERLREQEQRRQAAANELRRQLALANAELRKNPRLKKQPKVSRRTLASTVGLNRQYLTERAGKLEVDLTPYTLLYGPPPPDPLASGPEMTPD